MGVRFIHDIVEDRVSLYDSVTSIAFGPIFEHEDDAREAADAFLEWLPNDARTYSQAELIEKHADWKVEREKEEAA
jgi:hypothetical protein